MALPGGLGFHWAASECRGTGWAGTTSGERDEPGRKNFSSQNDTGQRLGETSASNRCPACKRTTRPRQRLSAAGVKRVDLRLNGAPAVLAIVIFDCAYAAQRAVLDSRFAELLERELISRRANTTVECRVRPVYDLLRSPQVATQHCGIKIRCSTRPSEQPQSAAARADHIREDQASVRVVIIR